MSQPNENHDNNNNNNNLDHKDTKIFVGGLAWRTTTDDLRNFFQQFGDVLDANVVLEAYPTRRSKGYGFVTFRDAESAARALVNPYPVIDGRRANINLAYQRARINNNHTNNHQSNQNGLLHQAGPSHQYQNGLLHQAGPSHQYQNGPVNQYQAGPSHQYQNGPVNQMPPPPHQYQLAPQYPNQHVVPFHWYPNYGQFRYITVPYNTYHMAQASHQHHVSTYGTLRNYWSNIQRPSVRITDRQGSSIQIQDVNETNQEVAATEDVTDMDTGPDSDASDQQQDATNQEGEIMNGSQENGFEENAEAIEIENFTARLNENDLEGTSQNERVIEEEAEDTPQANGLENVIAQLNENDSEGTSQNERVIEEEAEDTPQANELDLYFEIENFIAQLNENAFEGTSQNERVIEEEAEETPQANGLDQEVNCEFTSQENEVDQEA